MSEGSATEGSAISAEPLPRTATLADTWVAYRAAYVQDDGRVIDPAGGGRSTSEGQAYALVRAVWMDDPESFALVRTWTIDNLQGGDPTALPAWRWGKTDGGEWTILDAAPASDADQWLAWALLGAAERWDEPAYAEQARALLARIWDEEVLLIEGHPVLLPGPWARKMDPVRLNPSYWLPFAWRTFALADPDHPWASLIGPAYDLFDRCRAGAKLPPDWCHVRLTDGAVVAAPTGYEADGDFGFEAFRIAWTLAAEASWYREPRAKRLLKDFTALGKRWESEGLIPAVIAPDGRGRVGWDYPGMYGAILPALGQTRASVAEALWTRALEPRRLAHGWGDPADYYGQNWVWFGWALWRGALAPMGPT
ncbi:MAG: glycosyl hydrolase family 8 [Pseudomonadota bacterium]|nr:glycosyl hydrolase family 8 [Pseudomonadota bacterium]